jgi:hypothetical protein
LLRASRDDSNANTMATSPRPTWAASSAKPVRPAVEAPLTPRSSSTMRTLSRAHPSDTARSTRSYWRAVDSLLRSTWPAVDWRTYTSAPRRRCAAVILGCSLIVDHLRCRRRGRGGDQTSQLADRGRHCRVGQLSQQILGWRRPEVVP